MSEVHRYKVVKMLSEGGNRLTYSPHGPSIVMAEAYDAERALRLAAERQAGELTTHLAAYKTMLPQAEADCKALQAKLDTTMGLLSRIGSTAAMTYMVRQEWNAEFCDLVDEFNSFLNTNRTEGKDHE